MTRYNNFVQATVVHSCINKNYNKVFFIYPLNSFRCQSLLNKKDEMKKNIAKLYDPMAYLDYANELEKLLN
jgi:hypothetical protein